MAAVLALPVRQSKGGPGTRPRENFSLVMSFVQKLALAVMQITDHSFCKDLLSF